MFETERAELINQYKTQGEEERAKLIEEGKREAQRISDNAVRAAENELAFMQQKIESELIEASLKRAQELLEKQVNFSDHRRLTQEYFKQVGAHK